MPLRLTFSHTRRWQMWAGTILLGSLGVALWVFWSAAQARNPVVINETAVPPVPTLNPALVARGATVYAQQCASCHGANLEGAPNWKQRLPDGSLPPPPHDSSGHTWHHPDALLLDIIANGGDPIYNSKMPGFKEKLTQEEGEAVLEFIKSKWGKDERDFQWWITATQNDP
jgi:mono/diheme cytochrome c family protein